jgi:hypothetical protein
MATASLYGMEKLDIKRGASLVLGCTARAEDGQAADLTGCTVTAQARKAGQLVAELMVQMLDAPQGTYELAAPGDTTTAGWPVGAVEVDILYAWPPASGRRSVLLTETFVINVKPNVSEVPQ